MTEVYITTALFILLTVVFWKGKGTWLIAGYNMINDKEKEKYSRKKTLPTDECLHGNL